MLTVHSNTAKMCGGLFRHSLAEQSCLVCACVYVSNKPCHRLVFIKKFAFLSLQLSRILQLSFRCSSINNYNLSLLLGA